MGRVRFVTDPGEARYDISDGDWVIFKTRLDIRDRQRVDTAGLKRVSSASGETEVGIDWENQRQARVLVYLVDWSFVDASGKRVAITKAAVDALDVESFVEIEKVLDTHVKSIEAATAGQSVGEAKPPSASGDQ